jgi:hypothetical protein
MSKRNYRELADAETGLHFRFAYEIGASNPLHIEYRHGVTTGEAVETFFDGLTTWNATNRRFETRTETHTLYWTWHASGSVLVITCFRKEDH